MANTWPNLLVHCSNEICVFMKVVHRDVYYNIYKFGRVCINVAFSYCQTLNSIRKEYQIGWLPSFIGVG